MNVVSSSAGRVVRRQQFTFEYEHGCAVARPIGPALGARQVTLEMVCVPAGHRWEPPVYADEENNVVIFSGLGRGEVHGKTQGNAVEASASLSTGVALHSPTGCTLALEAASGQELVGYVWRSRLGPGRARSGMAPKIVSSIWNPETQLVGFTGYGALADATACPATMNFIFWPGTGSAQLCLHCGIQQPGQTFNVHFHPHCEEAFLAIEGRGEVFLLDRWIEVEAGDVLFAPPGLPHGARNPFSGPGAKRFVTCGGPTPFDPMLYERAGVSAEVR